MKSSVASEEWAASVRRDLRNKPQFWIFGADCIGVWVQAPLDGSEPEASAG